MTRPQKGILLIEVIVALMILGVGLTAVTHTFSSSLRGARAIQNYFYAILFFENYLWDLEQGSLGGDENAKDAKRAFTISTEDEDLELAGLHQSVMTLEWDDGGRAQSMSITSYVLKSEDDGDDFFDIGGVPEEIPTL